MKARLAIGVVALLLTLVLGFVMLMEAPVSNVAASSVGAYEIQRVAAGTTAYITTGGTLTGWNSDGYGSAVVQVDSTASNTTSTLTIVPMYSNEINVPCGSVTSWFTGTDMYFYPIAAQYQILPGEVSYTVNSTDSLPLTGTSTGSTTMTVTGSAPYVITSTYTYGSPVTHTLTAASAQMSAQRQTMATTGTEVEALEFTVYGQCMRLSLDVSYGTVTPTIYVMMRDIQQ